MLLISGKPPGEEKQQKRRENGTEKEKAFLLYAGNTLIRVILREKWECSSYCVSTALEFTRTAHCSCDKKNSTLAELLYSSELKMLEMGRLSFETVLSVLEQCRLLGTF